MDKSLFNYRYQVLEKLGEGAQGEVNLALDTVTNQKVAIKVLHCGQEDAWQKLFKHEFEILADMAHPYLAEVHDFGVTNEGRIYFTRDFVDGTDLLRGTSGRNATQFVAVCVQICRALRPLHRSGLIHGDIKPGNLVLGPLTTTADGTVDCSVWPIDFSFVRAASGPSPSRGTLQYIAPEILENKSIDVRADLYALGISIYEAASGEVPFEGDVNTIVQAHLKAKRPVLVPSRIKATNETEVKILEGLPAIINRLLCYLPQERFPDIDELEAALTGLCACAVAVDDQSNIPSRNVLANKDGFTKKIIDGIAARRDNKTDAAFFIIEGEVGSGRSAVRKAVKWQAQLDGFNVIELSFGGASNLFGFLSELLQQTAILLGGTDGATECQILGEKLVNFSQTDAEIHLIAASISGLLSRAASDKPLLLTVENIERAPTEALTVLRHAVAQSMDQSASAAPLLVLGTTTPDFAWRDLLGLGESFYIPMLNEGDIAALVKQYLGIDGAPLAPKIMAHTGGNPLFVTRLLIDCIKTSKSPEHIVAQTVVTDLQTYWQNRMNELAPVERQLLWACAVLNRPSGLSAIATVADISPLDTDVITPLLAKLCREHWLQQGQSRFSVRSTSLMLQVLEQISETERRAYAKRAFEVENNLEQKIIHAAMSGKIGFLNTHAISTIQALESHGALSIAKPLLLAVLSCKEATEIATEAKLILGRVEIALGELEAAAIPLGELKDSELPKIKQSALRYLGKIAVQQVKLDEAADLLERALSIDEHGDGAPSIFYELCEIEFRRGRYTEAIEIANRGLDMLDESNGKRANLLCSKAKGHAALGRHDTAMVLADEAVAFAVGLNQKLLLAFARDVRSWVLSLKGNVQEATIELEKCANLYREVGDTPRLARSLQVIGNNYWWLEKWAMMLKKHSEAMRVVASLDNPVGRNEQHIAYGYALNCIGRFEKSALVLSRAKQEALRLANDFQISKVAVYEGNLHAWQGAYDEALDCWKIGYEGFKQFSNFSLLAELSLEMASAHIYKRNRHDFFLAEQRIKEAASYNREDLGRHFEHLLCLTKGQLLLAKGEFEEGSGLLDKLIASLKKLKIRELQWQANLFLAEALLEKGLHVLARKKLREAEALLFALAQGLPAAHQVSFWQDVRRAKIKNLLQNIASEQLFDSAQFDELHDVDAEASDLYKVLEINKRISKETDVNLLMEEILDAAIELTGAERGFFLAKAKDGLQVRAAREMSHGETESPHLQFSSSIAESVYLDREPVVTVDAASDNRFNEFLSIHHLQIKSVACLPIAYRTSVLGVLYLENRLAKGKFDHRDMRVLSAFADQMAIGLAHAKAIEETVQTQRKLEDTAAQLQELVNQQSEDLKTKEAGLELAKEQLHRIKKRVEGTGNYHGLIGSGPAMEKVFGIIERVKNNDIPVTIIGPSGSGKDLVARTIHDVSKRQSGPFVSLACGAVPENLVESTLFGHVQGAFSGAGKDVEGIFAAAMGGTLYLDDLAEMPRRMQVDLLRILQEGTFTPLGGFKQIRADFRLLCSSKVPLSQLVENGLLRSDLFYRLEVVSIELPALKDRKEDIPVLAAYIAKNESAKLEIPYVGFETSLLTRFANEPWDGNIREMEQSIRRALVIGGGVDMLQESAVYHHESTPPEPRFGKRRTKTDDEREQIVAALEKAQWNKTRAAELLGMPRRTFYRRLKYFDIV